MVNDIINGDEPLLWRVCGSQLNTEEQTGTTTRAMNVPGGCLVTTTVFHDRGVGSILMSTSMAFVPGVAYDGDEFARSTLEREHP